MISFDLQPSKLEPLLAKSKGFIHNCRNIDGAKMSEFFGMFRSICWHFCPRISFQTFEVLEYIQKFLIFLEATSYWLLVTVMLMTVRDFWMLVTKMKISEPSLRYWNQANKTKILVTDKIVTRIFRPQNTDLAEKHKNYKIRGASSMFSSARDASL